MPYSIGRYSAQGAGAVNTYWIETSHGVVVIDGQRSPSQARLALREIEKTGKPILAIFLTHPHPDHFGGLGIFAAAAPDAPIYGSATTRDSVAEDRQGYIALSREAMKEDFPDRPTLPNRILQDGEIVEIDGLRLQAHEMGPGEAVCMTMLSVEEDGALFTADLIQHEMTAFLVEGRSEAWLLQLSALERRFPHVTRAYPGHGLPGPLSTMIRSQKQYLNRVRETAAAGDSILASRAMEQAYPGYQPVALIPDLLIKNAEAVAQELKEKA